MDLVSGVFRSRDEGKTWTPGADLHAEMPRGKDALAHATNDSYAYILPPLLPILLTQ